MEKKIIVLEGIANDWYFNQSKNTFILHSVADIYLDAYTFTDSEIPMSVFKVALDEFGCSFEYLTRNLIIKNFSL